MSLSATNHVYKFLAIAGLTFSLLALTAAMRDVKNENIRKIEHAQLWEARDGDSLTKEEKMANITLRSIIGYQEAHRRDSKIIHNGLSMVAGCSLLVSVFGFWGWLARVQPDENERALLELIKLQQEVGVDSAFHLQEYANRFESERKSHKGKL